MGRFEAMHTPNRSHVPRRAGVRCWRSSSAPRVRRQFGRPTVLTIAPGIRELPLRASSSGNAGVRHSPVA